MGRKKQISDQRRLYTERMRLQKGVFSSLANAALSQCSQWTKNVDMIERLEAMEELMSRVEQEQKSQKRGK